jgi:T5SS/PEP-CTERM-associated repeat protein
VLAGNDTIHYTVTDTVTGASTAEIQAVNLPAPETFAWDGTSGMWSSAADWSDLTSTQGGPPTSEDKVMFQNGAGVVSGSGNAGTLDVAAGMWSLGGTIVVAGETDVGETDAASLTIGGGGSVVGGGGATIAAAAGTDGSSVSVIGSDSTWALGGQLQVGDVAEGSLTVTSQAAVTVSSLVAGGGSTGSILVTGAGSSIRDAGQLIIGDGGVGELSITNGATVTAADLQLGCLAGSSGNVDIEGAGSIFHVTGNVDIGVGGLGVLTVGPGATLDVVGNLNEGAEGVLNIIGGVVDPGNGVLGGTDPIGNGGTLVYTGTLTLTGTISVTGCTGELDVGTLTGPGTLAVGDGGNFVLADGAGGDGSIATVGSSVPTIQFLGPAGTLTVQNASVLGTLDVASFAAGDILALPNLAFAATAIAAPGTVDLLDAAGGVVGAVQYGGQVSGVALAAGIVGEGHSVPTCASTH